MKVVIAPRYTLTILPKDATPLVQAAQSVCDNDLVPKGSSGIYSGYIGNGQVQFRHLYRCPSSGAALFACACFLLRG